MRFLGIILFFVSSLVFAADNEAGFTLTTTAVLDEGAVPVLYTCDGKDISPQFSWTNAPADTQSFALVISDPDAKDGTWYHWVLYNIPANVSTLEQAAQSLPQGTEIAKNSWGKAAYNGPCPPKGSVHTYVANLYALNTKIESSPSSTKELVETIKKHIIKDAKLTMVYSRWIS